MYEIVPASLPNIREWRAYFRDRGLDKKTIDSYIAYIKPIHKHNIPVIFDKEHLCRLLGRTPEFITKVVAATERFYRKFEIPKKTGGVREIQAPYPSLLDCQRWIGTNILSNIPLTDAAIGYVANRSIRDYIHPHLLNKEMFVTDIKDFFPSISISRVVGIFRSLGYSQEISFLLAKICTLNNKLPQGSATSPLLSNIVCRRLDMRLSSLAQHELLQYTRYADDLCFSGERITPQTQSLIYKILNSEGFNVNAGKTRKYSTHSKYKILAGINIASGDFKLPKHYTRELCLSLYHIEKHGLISHMSKLKIRKPNYLFSLLGRLNYWLWVEPENKVALAYKTILLQAIQSQRF